MSQAPCFRYAIAITPHDTNEQIVGAKYLMNVGTSGIFTVRQNAGRGAPTAAATVVVGCEQYKMIPCGSTWVGVNSTGLGAGVVLKAFF